MQEQEDWYEAVTLVYTNADGRIIQHSFIIEDIFDFVEGVEDFIPAMGYAKYKLGLTDE